MRSRFMLVLMVAAGITVVSGCSFKVNEGPLPDAGANMNSADMGCLSKSSATLQDFFDGKASGESIDKLCRCASRSLVTFGQLVRGAQRGKYTPRELRNFLKRYFLGDLNIRDQLLVEAMLIKQTVMGGNTSEMSLGDLDHAVEMIETMRQQMQRLRPYMPIDPVQMEKAPAEIVDEAARAMVEVADAVGHMVELTGVPYSFKQLDSLLGEIKILFPQAESPGLLQDKIALMSNLKAILVSPGADLISGQDWSLIFKQAARSYGIFLRFRHLNVQFESLTQGEGRTRLRQIVEDSKNLFVEAIQRHGEIITFEELDSLIDQIPFGTGNGADAPATGSASVSKETIKTVLRPIVMHMLGGPDADAWDGRKAKGITVALLGRVMKSFDQWHEGQRYLEGLFGRLHRGSGNSGVWPHTGFTPEELRSVKIEDALRENGGINDIALEVARDLLKVITESRPLFRGDNNEISFPGPTDERHRSFHNLSEMNWMRQAIKLLMSGYADDRFRAKAYGGVNLKEFSRFVSDVWPITVDLLLVNPENKKEDEANKRFREANLFTPAANGDDFLGLDEGSQLLAFMLSAKRLSNRTHDLAAKHCETGPNDFFGAPTIDAPCYRRLMFSRQTGETMFEVIWQYMPGVSSYYRNLPNDQLWDFQFNLEEAARKKGYQREVMMNSTDSEGLAMVTHYVESLYTRYDRDDSGTIDAREARMAYPQFRKTLTEVSGFGRCRGEKEKNTVDDKVEALFTYLLAHGEPPVTNDMNDTQKLKGALNFWFWRQRKKMGGWYFQSPRTNILKVFAQIGRLTDPAAAPGVPPAPCE